MDAILAKVSVGLPIQSPSKSGTESIHRYACSERVDPCVTSECNVIKELPSGDKRSASCIQTTRPVLQKHHRPASMSVQTKDVSVMSSMKLVIGTLNYLIKVTEKRRWGSGTQFFQFESSNEDDLMSIAQEVSYRDTLLMEEEFWASMARLDWLHLGDGNTRFFLSSVISRRRQNKILGLANSLVVQKEDYNEIVKKIKDKVESWKAPMLSKAIRVTLIKSISAAMANYFMQALVSVCTESDKTYRKFLWGSNSDRKKRHLVKWDDVCCSKDLGGWLRGIPLFLIHYNIMDECLEATEKIALMNLRICDKNRRFDEASTVLNNSSSTTSGTADLVSLFLALKVDLREGAYEMDGFGGIKMVFRWVSWHLSKGEMDRVLRYHFGICRRLTCGYYNYGQVGHMARECPKRKEGTSVRSNPTPRGTPILAPPVRTVPPQIANKE
ncbi:putative RNA-directed DNA polymerase [Senna tora]|uniref:Putative RNA-directed DNA polymerase n=1 Tax=Senna tora TaxID=362788 RepID=A0A835CA41_9FABA|nr:putative RNA-directed DNA polymerase [Senna tora]